MSQSELEEAVAHVTGESIRTIRRHGFSLVTPLRVFDPDENYQAEPQIVDWDAVQARRLRPAA